MKQGKYSKIGNQKGKPAYRTAAVFRYKQMLKTQNLRLKSKSQKSQYEN